MRFTGITVAAALAVGVIAVPLEGFSGFEMGDIPDIEPRSTSKCLCDNDAKKVAQNFRALINSPFNETLAETALTSDFTDYSDSVIELINQGCTPGTVPLTTATFSSRDEFIEGQSSQPPIPFTILKIWHNCNAVFLRWRTDAPGTVQPEQPVTGIIAIETVPNPKKRTDQPWLIKVVYSEFNSGAWLYDLGIFKPECKADGTPANPPPTVRRI